MLGASAEDSILNNLFMSVFESNQHTMFDRSGLERPGQIGLPVIESQRIGSVFGIARQRFIVRRVDSPVLVSR